MNRRRFIICFIGGLVSAIICLTGGIIRGVITDISGFILAVSIFNRIMIGFVIGMSGWRIHYLFHGAIIGLFISFISSIPFLDSDMRSFIVYTLAGIVYGILIELFSTKILKAKRA